MRGVFLDSATVDRHDLDLGALKSSLPDWSIRSTTPVDEVGDAIQDADIVISNKVSAGPEDIAARRFPETDLRGSHGHQQY